MLKYIKCHYPEFHATCNLQATVSIDRFTTYLKNLPHESVSSKRNLQVADKFRKACELFLSSKNKRVVGVWAARRSNNMHSFLCYVIYLECYMEGGSSNKERNACYSNARLSPQICIG